MTATVAPEPVVPPTIIDPEPDETDPVIPEPDPTHTPVLPRTEPDPQPDEAAAITAVSPVRMARRARRRS